MYSAIHAGFEGTKAALRSIRSHAMRSALTTLGVIIGVAAVITVVAVMQGLSSSITDQLEDLGSDMVTLRAHTSREQEMLGFRNEVSYDDFIALKAKVTNVLDMTATMRAFSMGAVVQYGRSNTQTQIIGTDSSYQNVVKVFPEMGRFISPSDDLRRRRVVFIGMTIVEKLGMPANPIGEYLSLNGEWFLVVGVAEKRGQLFGFDQDNYIIAPFSTIASLNGQSVTRNIDIMFRPSSADVYDDVVAQMRHMLRKRHGLKTGDDDDFEFVTAKKAKENFNNITTSVTMVAGGIVGISLLVGGIGIMNIMLVSVTERTREIGILKALGATPNFIMLQFLVEALVLSLFGGVLGLIIGWGLASLLALMLSMPEALVPMWAVLLSFGFTTAIGVIFGLAPAIKAAKLNPIDALRYE